MLVVGVPHRANATVSQEAVPICAVQSWYNNYSFKQQLFIKKHYDDMQAQQARISKPSR